MRCGYCKDCRWWLLVDRLTITEDGSDEWGWCDRLRVEGTLISLGSSRLNRFVSIDTAPNFGCVQWEAKI